LFLKTPSDSRSVALFHYVIGRCPDQGGRDIMDKDRRDLLQKIGMFGASALALMGVSKRGRADEATPSNPLVGLWDMTIPPPPGPNGGPTLYYKYAISEGAYVCTGNLDATTVPFGFKYSPTMGTYVRTGHNSYRLRERAWAMYDNGEPAGYSDFTGTAIVAPDGKSFSGSGAFNQYGLDNKPVFPAQNITYTAVRFSA
jgi:hypothetical protein